MLNFATILGCSAGVDKKYMILFSIKRHEAKRVADMHGIVKYTGKRRLSSSYNGVYRP